LEFLFFEYMVWESDKTMRRESFSGRKALALLLALLLLAGAAPSPGAGGTAGAAEMPGLEVRGITTNPGTIKAGEAAAVGIAFCNNGESGIGDFSVALYAGGKPGDMLPVGQPQQVAFLEAGSAAALDFTWTPPAAGEYLLTARIILEGAVVAEDTLPVSAGESEPEPEPEPEAQPALTVTDIAVDPAQPAAGTPAAVTAALANSGNEAAENFTVALYAGDESGDMLPVGQPQLVAFLEAGSAAARDFTWTPLAAGEYLLTAKIMGEDATVVNEMTVRFAVGPAAARMAALEEEGPLQLVELCPANGSAEVPLDTEIYIRFNKPANIEPALPMMMNYHIGDGVTGTYFLQPNADRTVWSLPAGSAVLEYQKTYTITSFMKITDDAGTVLYQFGNPLLLFPTWRFTTAELEVPVPADIAVTDFPPRLQMGLSYPLGAVVKDKKGEVLDWPVDWQVISVKNGRADVDGRQPHRHRSGLVNVDCPAPGLPQYYKP